MSVPWEPMDQISPSDLPNPSDAYLDKLAERLDGLDKGLDRLDEGLDTIDKLIERKND